MRRRDIIIEKINKCKTFTSIYNIKIDEFKFKNDKFIIHEPILAPWWKQKPPGKDEAIGVEITHYNKKENIRKIEKFYFTVPKNIRYGDKYKDWDYNEFTGWES